MPNFPVVMPIVFLLLLLLPIKLSGTQLKSLAFFLWILGGLFLSFRGVDYLTGSPEQPDILMLGLIVLAALAIGFGKGKFVLAKTSQKNIDRIDQFTERKRPIQVYSTRSWIVIALMVGISVSLTLFNMPVLWRGAVNLGIGFALVVSSLAYLRNAKPANIA